MIIGDSRTGKSSILSRLVEDKFEENHNCTIGVEFGNFLCKVNYKTINIQIWDTAGQESYRSIAR